jgi:hypothetical protein
VCPASLERWLSCRPALSVCARACRRDSRGRRSGGAARDGRDRRSSTRPPRARLARRVRRGRGRRRGLASVYSLRSDDEEMADADSSELFLSMQVGHLLAEELKQGPKTVQGLADACDMTESRVREALDYHEQATTAYGDGEQWHPDESKIGTWAFIRDDTRRSGSVLSSAPAIRTVVTTFQRPPRLCGLWCDLRCEIRALYPARLSEPITGRGFQRSRVSAFPHSSPPSGARTRTRARARGGAARGVSAANASDGRAVKPRASDRGSRLGRTRLSGGGDRNWTGGFLAPRDRIESDRSSRE